MFVRVSICFLLATQAAQIAAIARIVEAGGGLSLVPACVVKEELQEGKLVVLNVQQAAPQQQMVAAFSKAIVNRAVSEIIGIAREVIVDTSFVEKS